MLPEFVLTLSPSVLLPLFLSPSPQSSPIPPLSLSLSLTLSYHALLANVDTEVMCLGQSETARTVASTPDVLDTGPRWKEQIKIICLSVEEE